MPLSHVAEAAARQAVGSQFTMLWFSNRDQGWDIGLAPGALTLDQARDAIIAQLSTALAGDDVALLANTLHVVPQPYNEAELDEAKASILGQLTAAPLGAAWGLGVGCRSADAWRVDVQLFNDSTPATVEAVTRIIAPFGDRARLWINPFGPPTATALVPSPTPVPVTASPGRLSSYLALAPTTRCIAGRVIHVRARPAARRRIALLTVTVGARRVSAGPHRLAHGLGVRLGSRRTMVKVALRLDDGTRLARTLTYRRCG
jgi:hypothetical protein